MRILPTDFPLCVAFSFSFYSGGGGAFSLEHLFLDHFLEFRKHFSPKPRFFHILPPRSNRDISLSGDLCFRIRNMLVSFRRGPNQPVVARNRHSSISHLPFPILIVAPMGAIPDCNFSKTGSNFLKPKPPSGFIQIWLGFIKRRARFPSPPDKYLFYRELYRPRRRSPILIHDSSCRVTVR